MKLESTVFSKEKYYSLTKLRIFITNKKEFGSLDDVSASLVKPIIHAWKMIVQMAQNVW